MSDETRVDQCNEWHQHSDERLGLKHRCVRPISEAHGTTTSEPHWDAGGRWWCTSAVHPNPEPNNRAAIVDLVLEDIGQRDRVGQARYGTRLQAHNGRDALRDAYEEALDLAIYLRQVIEERNPTT